MRKVAFFIIVLLFTLKAFAQAEPANYAAALTNFNQFYNNNHPDSIFGMFSSEVKTAEGGPTEREGNNIKSEITANTYKLLAHDLGKNGIASLRYDKRGVGASVSTTTEAQLRIEDYSDDAVGLINMLNDDQRFSKIVVFGHGEGTLVGMVAMEDEPVKAFISAEGASEQADKILTDRMKSKPKYQADEFKTILDSLRRGKLTPNVDPALYYIARPSVQNFLM